MPEKICFTRLLGAEPADIDSIVPSLGDMEFDENCACLNHMMDLTKVDTPRLHHMQDSVFCDPLPMSPAMGIQHGNQKYRSHSTGGDLYAECHLPCSFDDTQSSFLQDLMQTGSITDIHGTIPIYNPFLNSSDLANTPTANNSPSASKALNSQQLQNNSLSSLLLGDLCDIDLDGFPTQAVAPVDNLVITEDWVNHWEQLYITTPTNIDNTAHIFKVPAVPASNNPAAHKYPISNPSPRAPHMPLDRMSSWPHINYKTEATEEPVVPFACNQGGQSCFNPSNSLMDNGNPISQPTLPPRPNNHRRAKSESNLKKFISEKQKQIVHGPQNPQLVSNEPFSMSMFVEQTQHQQNSSHSPNKHSTRGRYGRKQITHPYSHFHNYTTQANMNNVTTSHMAVNTVAGLQNTSSFSPLPYPATNTSTYSISSPRVDHSQSVPTSPSIHRAAESSPPPVTSLQQQFSNSYCRTAPPTTGGASNFSFDNIVPPTCDISTGTSQEEREEREKNEAFSRLHQGLHLWEFLMEILLTNDYQPILKWTDKENGVFKIVDSEALAKFWGEYRRKPKMNYDKMSRAIRYYYGKDILDKAPKRLYYQFKYHSHWWEKLQKVDASFKINHIPASEIPAPTVQDLIIPDDL